MHVQKGKTSFTHNLLTCDGHSRIEIDNLRAIAVLKYISVFLYTSKKFKVIELTELPVTIAILCKIDE